MEKFCQSGAERHMHSHVVGFWRSHISSGLECLARFSKELSSDRLQLPGSIDPYKENVIIKQISRTTDREDSNIYVLGLYCGECGGLGYARSLRKWRLFADGLWHRDYSWVALTDSKTGVETIRLNKGPLASNVTQWGNQIHSKLIDPCWNELWEAKCLYVKLR